MPRPLTQKSYRGVAKGLITSFNRLGEHGPWNRQKGVTANEIGNAFYAFGDPEARHWFETALVWYRRGGITDPWTGIAYLHWKLGNQEACTEECRRIIEYNGRKLEEKKSQGLEGVRLFREYDETAVAHFLLGDYETALRRVEEAAGLGIEGGISSHLYALRDMAEGVLAKDRALFEAGQALARKGVVFGAWPTGDTSQAAELYRYSLDLAGAVWPA